jgi:hypothetical protein
MHSMIDAAILNDDWAYGARPQVREPGTPPVARITSKAPRLPKPAPPPAIPCDGCRLALRCATWRETCAGYRYAVTHGNPDPAHAEGLRGMHMRKLRKFAD